MKILSKISQRANPMRVKKTGSIHGIAENLEEKDAVDLHKCSVERERSGKGREREMNRTLLRAKACHY